MTFLGNISRFASPPPARAALFLVLALTASGCGLWRNFSTYFNTLYLADQHLDIYEAQIGNPPAAPTAAIAVKDRRWLDEEYESRMIASKNGQTVRITPSFVRTVQGTAPKVTGNILHLDSAIILGSKVLAKGETKYVEDALFIIGKAQYYKNDYSGAKRKFMELFAKFPNTEYAAEAQTFLARAMIATGKLDTASTALTQALQLAQASGDKASIAAAQRAYAEFLYGKSADTLDAIRASLLKAEENLEGHEAAQMAFESGAIAYLEGKWSEAEASFGRAAEKSKQDYFTGEAKIAHAMALRRLGRFADAKLELAEVGEKNIYVLSHPAAKFEYAVTVESEARHASGSNINTEQFRSERLPGILDAYRIVDTSFKSESQAVLSRSKFKQAELYRALAQYDSASRYASTLIGTKDFSTQTYNDYVSEKMRSLARFSFWTTEILSSDTVLERVKRARSGQNESRLEAIIRAEAMKEVLRDRYRPDMSVQISQEDSIRLDAKISELRQERGLSATKITIGDTSRFLDSVNLRRGSAFYELGRAYENFEEIPKARDHYLEALDHRFIIQDTSKDAFRAQVYYAWLQLEHREKNIALRDSLLEILRTRYGQTIYAEQAQSFFGAQADLNSPAEQAYRNAYAKLRTSGVDAGKQPLIDVRVMFKNEDVAPRSLYAIGLTYEDQQRYDSALVYYKEILTAYPYSAYADALRPRMADVAVARPKRSVARRVDAPTKTPEELQMEEIERARQENERRLKEQEEQIVRPFGQPGEQPPPGSVPVPSEPRPPAEPSGMMPGK